MMNFVPTCIPARPIGTPTIAGVAFKPGWTAVAISCSGFDGLKMRPLLSLMVMPAGWIVLVPGSAAMLDRMSLLAVVTGRGLALTVMPGRLNTSAAATALSLE